MWNRECIIATSGTKERISIAGVSRVLDRNGPLAPCKRVINSRYFGAGLGPGTVDRYKVGIVGHRFDHAVGIVSAPRLVESKLDPTNGFLICFVHGRPLMHTAWSARGTPSIA